MKFTEENFHQMRPALPVMEIQEGYRLLAHGKWCPWCKCEIMHADTVVLVYRIQPQRYKDASMPYRLYFMKENWDYVCSLSCAKAMRESWRVHLQHRDKLIAKLKESKLPAIIRSKPGDTYRDTVLKRCRIDPKINMTEVLELTENHLKKLPDNLKAWAVFGEPVDICQEDS